MKPQELPQGGGTMGDLAQILMAIQMSSNFSEAMESVGSSADTDVKAIVETNFQLNDIASERARRRVNRVKNARASDCDRLTTRLVRVQLLEQLSTPWYSRYLASPGQGAR